MSVEVRQSREMRKVRTVAAEEVIDSSMERVKGLTVGT